MNSLSQAVKIIKNAKNILVLSGAGLSAESGIPTFRSKDGLWKNFKPEELATPQAFSRSPKTVWEWYDWRRQKIARCNPNKAHQILSDWEKRFTNFRQISQNVDDLLEKAGCQKVIKLHGSIFHTVCLQEKIITENHEVPLAEIPPKCKQCGSLLRPAVVWFGETIAPEVIDQCYQLLQNCDLLIIIGTSGVVYPAAQFAGIAKQNKAKIIEINIEETALSGWCDIFLKKTATSALGEINERL